MEKLRLRVTPKGTQGLGDNVWIEACRIYMANILMLSISEHVLDDEFQYL